MMVRKFVFSGFAVTGLVVAGCAVGPNYKPPQITVPDRYAATQPATQPITQALTTQPALATWWTSFNDPLLDKLIEQAVQSNLDLRLAEARVREARAARGVVASDYYPKVDAAGEYTRSRPSKNVAGDSSFVPTEGDLWTAGFDAAWEIDVFGRVKRSVQAADADIDSAIGARDGVLLSLLAEVARNYVELRGFQRQIDIAYDNVKSQEETLDLVQAKFNAGLTSDVDVARSEAQVASTRSQIPAQEQRAAAAMHRLAVLLGQDPASLNDELGKPAPLPAPPPEIPAGVPSELLRRRPDIHVAERNLASATARIGVATADLFPRFTILGSLGLQADKFTNLGDSSSVFWSIGPGVRWPVFNAGRVRSQIKVEEARTDQALTIYEQTILVALEEVENALVAYRQEYIRRHSLARAVASNERAVKLSQQLYQRGLANFLDVLDAQRSLYLSQDALAGSDTTVSSNAVALFKALGGGLEH